MVQYDGRISQVLSPKNGHDLDAFAKDDLKLIRVCLKTRPLIIIFPNRLGLEVNSSAFNTQHQLAIHPFHDSETM